MVQSLPITTRLTHTSTRLTHRHIQMADQPRDDRFTSDDRKALTEISVHMLYVRDAIEAMKTASTRVDTKMDTLHSEASKKIDTAAASLEHKMDRLDTRIRTLENWRWWIMGAAVAGGGAAGLLSRAFGIR